MISVPSSNDFKQLSGFINVNLRQLKTGRLVKWANKSVLGSVSILGSVMPNPFGDTSFENVLRPYLKFQDYQPVKVAYEGIVDDAAVNALCEFIDKSYSKMIELLLGHEPIKEAANFFLSNRPITLAAESGNLFSPRVMEATFKDSGMRSIFYLRDRLGTDLHAYRDVSDFDGSIFFDCAIGHFFKYFEWISKISLAFNRYLSGEAVFEATEKGRILNDVVSKIDEIELLLSNYKFKRTVQSSRDLQLFRLKIAAEIDKHKGNMKDARIRNDRTLSERLLIQDVTRACLELDLSISNTGILNVVSAVADKGIEPMTVSREIDKCKTLYQYGKSKSGDGSADFSEKDF